MCCKTAVKYIYLFYHLRHSFSPCVVNGMLDAHAAIHCSNRQGTSWEFDKTHSCFQSNPIKMQMQMFKVIRILTCEFSKAKL